MKKSIKFILLPLLLLCSLSLSGCIFTQYIAHYANMAGWTTRINIQNPHNIDVAVTVTCYDTNGVQKATANLTIPARGFYKEYVQNIFVGAIPVTGSLTITANEPTATPKVTTIALFEYAGGPAMGGLQSFQSPQKVMNIPWFENSSNFNTGLSVLNVNNYQIQAVVRATTSTGTVYKSNTLTLGPMQRAIGYPTDFFTGGLPADTNLSVYASGNIAGFIILHDNTYQKVEAINGVPQVATRVEVGQPIDMNNMDLNARPTRIACSPDGSTLYVRTESPARLFVVNVLTNTIVHTFNLSSSGDVAVSADGKSVYYSDVSTDRIYRMDPDSYATSEFATFTDPWQIAVSNDGAWVAASSATQCTLLSLIGTPPIALTGYTDIRDMIFSEDSKYLLFVDYSTKKVHGYEINTATKKEVTLSDSPRCLIQGPGTNSIYVGTSGTRVYLITYPNITIASNIITAGGLVYQLTFSPDGRLLYIPCCTDQHCWTYNTLTMKMTDLEAFGGSVICIRTSPEGDRVYYVVNSSPYTLKYLM